MFIELQRVCIRTIVKPAKYVYNSDDSDKLQESPLKKRE